MKSKQRKWKRKAFTAAVLAGTLTLGGLPVHAFSDESGLNAIEEQIPETDPSDIPEAEPGGYLADEYDLNAPESFYAETDIRTDEEELLLGDSEIPAAYPEDPEEVLTALPPVRSQYSETCWAFSAVGNAEIGRIMNGTRDTAVDFSELALVYSNYHLLTDPLGGTAGDAIEITTGQSYLDIGGTYSFAWNTLMGWWGVLEEQDLPFQSETISMLKQNGWSSEAAQNDTVRLHTVRNMNRHTNRDAIKRAIMSGGAVSGSVYSGTYSGNSLYNASTKAYYSDHSCGTNHAVLIVGWDDSFSADNFAVKPPADGAWLVRNSWGEQAIDYSGYYWLSYEDQSAASAFYSCEFVENDSFYDRNYQYDGCRYSKNIVPSSEGTPLVAANVFDVKSAAEELKAVMVSIGSADSVCTVRIYTGLTDSADPESGELKAETTTNVDFAGYYTMELPEAVALAGGEKYSVVVEVSCASGKPSIGVEKTATVNGISHTASIKAGQSFSKAAGSSKYTDLIKNKNSWGNLRIKAFTDVVDDRPAPEPTASPEPT
ncbi:MAG: lectin like domain-containing protein, partial [Eubacteriales bacterium]|nr:lectin like domain-containing protein [Eubacteriales bacterium]